MNANPTTLGPLVELLESQQQEIARFKWIESEKAGRDIGWQAASAQWFDRHFADWLRSQRGEIDQALARTDPRMATPSRSRPSMTPLAASVPSKEGPGPGRSAPR